jgi:GalNAc-alpha-(1->4)-GalNAc-alpha-(1->3)-diNAcBac-PP-undecaprenol alpha-1,4-N-acetyl-D-galactosaminyltransferase
MPVADSAVAHRLVIVVGSMTAGGAERVAVTMANSWVEQGREVWLVSTYLGSRALNYSLDARVSLVFLADSTRQTRVPVPAMLRKIPALRRAILVIAPDVVVSFLSNVNVLAIAALLKTRIPLIVSERVDPAAEIELSRSLRLARALSYRYADALVVQTASAARRYRERLPRLSRIAVIRNPLPAELSASPVRASQGSGGGCVIAMGRLTPQKCFAKLIEAFRLAFGADNAWRLQIWGDGPQRRELQGLVQNLKLHDRVEICGATTQPWSVLAAAQIFAMSSQYEGFPNAMLEAMAIGLPCVAFDCPSGPRELADNGSSAIIVPPANVPLLAEALRDLARDRERREQLGKRAAEFVRREFSQTSVMAEWDTLIGEVIRGRKTMQRN